MSDNRICRNVTVSGRRTSLRMEAYLWESLREVCEREQLTLNTLCTLVDERRGEANLTAELRVFLLRYFRRAARFSEDQAGPSNREPSEHLKEVLRGIDPDTKKSRRKSRAE